MKTKENGENIYKMLNPWLKNCRSTLAFRGNRGHKERDQKETTWRAVEQFLIVFLSTIRDQDIPLKAVHISLSLSLKSSLYK